MQKLPNSNFSSRQSQVPSPTPASRSVTERPQGTKTPEQQAWKFVKKYGLFVVTPLLGPLPGLAALTIGKVRKAQRQRHDLSYHRLPET